MHISFRLTLLVISAGLAIAIHIQGGWKNFVFTRHKFLLVTVKERLKSVLNYRSYPQIKLGIRFLDHPVHSRRTFMLHGMVEVSISVDADFSKHECVRI